MFDIRNQLFELTAIPSIHYFETHQYPSSSSNEMNKEGNILLIAIGL